MSRWAQGAEDIQELIADGRLEVVQASDSHAAMLLEEAGRHLSSARQLASNDATAAYSVMYDGVRKSLSAILAKQGLRATSAGGHVAVGVAVAAQMGSTRGVIAAFNGMRRRRHEAEYPSVEAPGINEFDVIDALPSASSMIEAAVKMVAVVGPWES